VEPRPLRWLVAAPFSASPSGKRVTVSGERFTTIMGQLAPVAEVTVPDRLGRDEQRTVALKFQRPRDFQGRGVANMVDVLRELGEVADRLAKNGDLPAAIRQVRSLVGDGRLADALEGRTPAPVAAPRRSAGSDAGHFASADDSDDDDPIFGKANVTTDPEVTKKDAKTAVGSFISAIRSGSAAKKTDEVAPARDAAVVVRDAIGQTALDVLSAPEVAPLERSWRALRMIMAASPGSDDLRVDAVDADTTGLLDALKAPLAAEPFDRPDAVFVAGPISDAVQLEALADLADEARVPIIVEVPPSAAGFAIGDDAPGDVPQAWGALRGRASAGWLCAVVGQAVLAHDRDADAVGGERTVCGGGSAVIAAMAAASVGESATPANIVGKGGALVAPAAHELVVTGQRQTIPTRAFISYTTQRALADRGITALGSEVGSDRIRLAAAPMVGGDMSLPARILAGRAHRLAVEVRRQLGSQASAAELERALEEASGVFLPRVGAGDVTLRVRDADAGNLEVDTTIGAVLAGASVKFSSDV